MDPLQWMGAVRMSPNSWWKKLNWSDIMLNFSNSVPTKKQTHPHLKSLSLSNYILFIFCVNYSFKITLLIKCQGTFSSWSVNGWPQSMQNSLANLKKNQRPFSFLLLEINYKDFSHLPHILRYINSIHYPIADDNSSVVPKASNIWSSFGLLSPVKVLEKPNEVRYRKQNDVYTNLALPIWHATR